MCAIFFSGEGVAIQVQVSRGKRVTTKYYTNVILKKLKKNKKLSDTAPSHGFQKCPTFKYNASAHTSTFVTFFFQVCKKEKVTFFAIAFLFTRPCRFSFFGNSNPSSMDGDIGQDRHLDLPYTNTLPVYHKSAYHDSFKKWILRLKKYAFLVMGTALKTWNKLRLLTVWTFLVNISIFSLRTPLVQSHFNCSDTDGSFNDSSKLFFEALLNSSDSLRKQIFRICLFDYHAVVFVCTH